MAEIHAGQVRGNGLSFLIDIVNHRRDVGIVTNDDE